MTRVKAALSNVRARSLAMVATVLLAPWPASAQPQDLTLGASDWAIWGAAYRHQRDTAVPGHGIVVPQPDAYPKVAWSSGATMPIPSAIAAGEQVTAVFWARAARPILMTIALQGGAPGYTRFGSADLRLTSRWQSVSVRGTAPPTFAANSQSLSVPLGETGAAVELGPVAFLRGTPSKAAVARAFAAFRPSEVATDIRIVSEPGVTLAGTLHLPVGTGHAPYPLAIVLQGHGPNGRGGYTEIIRRLTAHGIAALEYDKRGIGQSTGIFQEDVERLTADARAAVATMRRNPAIDGRRIALVGHSQGGVIAPAVAAADPTIAAVVTLAGSVGDGLPYLRQAMLSQMRAAGRPQAVAEPAADAALALLQARVDRKDAATIAQRRAEVIARFEAAGFPRPLAEGALARIDTEEVWRADKLRSASDLKALQMPVLAVFAEKDPLVVASIEAADARKALAANPQASVVVLGGLSHWFQEGAVTGGEEEVAKLGPNAGSPRLVALVGDWLDRVLGEKPQVAATAPPR
ncbi:pimeloyl-ACP methyl ester carboxylesterase [Sphingomonas trueperi]|uniref:alpha/beta hydrolase n=1 Tax=Sphingomonas trueperi TaxID=53317 RepID=UPI00339836E7